MLNTQSAACLVRSIQRGRAGVVARLLVLRFLDPRWFGSLKGPWQRPPKSCFGDHVGTRSLWTDDHHVTLNALSLPKGSVIRGLVSRSFSTAWLKLPPSKCPVSGCLRQSLRGFASPLFLRSRQLTDLGFHMR